MKKIITITMMLLSVFLLMMFPSISAVEYTAANENIYDAISDINTNNLDISFLILLFLQLVRISAGFLIFDVPIAKIIDVLTPLRDNFAQAFLITFVIHMILTLIMTYRNCPLYTG